MNTKSENAEDQANTFLNGEPALSLAVKRIVDGYLANHVHGLFAVECDDVVLCGPTTDVVEIATCMLCAKQTTLFCMSGESVPVTCAHFDWSMTQGRRDTLSDVGYCAVGASPYLYKVLKNALNA